MFIYRLKSFLKIVVATVFSCACVLAIACANATRLYAIEGERTYYLDAQTASALRKSELSLSDLFRIKGECVRFALGEETPEAIARRYGAEILFTESSGGSVSYYCYTRAFSGGVAVRGETVNLHIAVNGRACAVGTPLIFDGF